MKKGIPKEDKKVIKKALRERIDSGYRASKEGGEVEEITRVLLIREADGSEGIKPISEAKKRVRRVSKLLGIYPILSQIIQLVMGICNDSRVTIIEISNGMEVEISKWDGIIGLGNIMVLLIMGVIGILIYKIIKEELEYNLIKKGGRKVIGEEYARYIRKRYKKEIGKVIEEEEEYRIK